MKFKQAKNEDWITTSFHNDRIIATPNQLEQILGPVTFDENNGEDKVNIEWNLLLEDGTFFTVYDWKQYKPLQPNTHYQFYIGAKDPADSKKALLAINKALNQK